MTPLSSQRMFSIPFSFVILRSLLIQKVLQGIEKGAIVNCQIGRVKFIDLNIPINLKHLLYLCAADITSDILVRIEYFPVNKFLRILNYFVSQP